MSFYGYRINLSIDEQPHDVAVLYKYDNGGYEKALDETIDDLTRRRIPPDRILIICPKGLEPRIREEYARVSDGTKERLRAVTHVVVAAFTYDGRILPEGTFKLNEGASDWTLSDNDVDTIVEVGMEEIIESTGTRMKAPPGYLFRKPSENTNRVFIRAGNMVRNPAALSVIFHAMVRKIPLGAKRLYIDSFTILSIALNYQSCMAKLAKECGIEFEVPTITNFHSYSMDSRLTFEGTNEYMILISATSSGGLVDKLVTERHAQRDKTFHLLVFSPNEKLKQTAVFFRKEDAKINDDGAKAFRRIISIPGEEFLASHGETRTVDITVSHLVPSERKIYKDAFYQNTLCLNLSESDGYGSSYRPIGLQPSRDVGSKEFNEWLFHQAHVELPRSILLVVFAEGERSKRLANEVVRLMAPFQKEKIKPISATKLEGELRKRTDLDGGTVLVVASDESSGEGLLSISQMLREKPKLHRHYLIGHLFPASAGQFRRLRSNLQTSGSAKKYGWSVYCTTPVGDIGLHQTWLQERDFGYGTIKLPQRFKPLEEAMHLRAKALLELSLTRDAVFLPKTSGESLELRDGSVLFDKEYEGISHVSIYLQLAAALQRARDRQLIDGKTVLREELCFESNPFIDTVIDPDTFSRFNDGVIQAAILRAASPAELNYSRDKKLSLHMLAIFEGIVQSRDRPRGEAVLEFMFAAFLKKLRFDEEHFIKVERLILNEPELKAVWVSFSNNPPF